MAAPSVNRANTPLLAMKSDIVISDIRYKKAGDLNPLIVDFQNGDLIDVKSSQLTTNLLPHENLGNKSIEISTVDGQKYFNQTPDSLSGTRFVAVRNKKTNKVRLVEVECTVLMNSIHVHDIESEKHVENVWQQTATLKKVFGTKRAVLNIQKSEILNVDKSNISDQINEVLADGHLNESSLITLNESNNDLLNFIPPCNRDSKNRSEIYKIQDLLSEQELLSLKDAASDILSNKSNIKNCSEFVKKYLPELLQSHENISEKICCLFYAEALVNYLKAPVRSLGKMSSTFCTHSQLICHKIIGEFCVKNGSTVNRPLAMKDKAVCYVIVLVLLACNFLIDLEALAKMINYGLKKIKQLGRIVGIVPTSKTSNVYALTVPLPALPKTRNQTKKK